jgi:hypothetical protein
LNERSGRRVEKGRESTPQQSREGVLCTQIKYTQKHTKKDTHTQKTGIYKGIRAPNRIRKQVNCIAGRRAEEGERGQGRAGQGLDGVFGTEQRDPIALGRFIARALHRTWTAHTTL